MGENHGSRPFAVTGISLFFIFGTLMSGLAAIMLLFQGSPIEPLWRLNPRAQEAFASMDAAASEPHSLASDVSLGGNSI